MAALVLIYVKLESTVIFSVDPYNPDDVTVPLLKNLVCRPGDLNMPSLDKMAVGWVMRTCRHERRPG